MKRALVVDDHPIFRNGLKLTLTYELEMSVDEAATVAEALAYIAASPPDLVIMDLDLPDMDGLEATKKIRKLNECLPIVVVSGLKEKGYAQRAMKAGAMGFVQKDAEKQIFVATIRDILREQIYRKQHREAHTKPALKQTNSDELYHSLSNREYQVFCLLALGKTPADIADELGISRKTVSVQRAHILTKLQLENNAEIMHYALKHELVKII